MLSFTEALWQADPAAVVDTALKALDRPFPTVVSDRHNRVVVLGYRIAPRPVLAMVSEQLMKATGQG